MEILSQAASGKAITFEEACVLIECPPRQIPALISTADLVRKRFKGRCTTFSKKVFIPLTNLCRNRCGYCIFRKEPWAPEAGVLTPEQVLQIARRGQESGCKEALFCLGDKPEETHEEARKRLRSLGYETTLDYLVDLCALVLKETGLLPHTNAGVINEAGLRRLKLVNASLGLMLENVSQRLCGEGGPHQFSPDKDPRVRLAMIEDAGKLKIPFTTGLLIGIGETVKERVASLFALKELHDKYGHIQEIIIQNFLPKPGTPMASYPPPTLDDMLRTIAVARLIFQGTTNIQVPPNLNLHWHELYLFAGVNDWGGISPVTRDLINPTNPWPQVTGLKMVTEWAGFQLRERLPIYPEYVGTQFMPQALESWIRPLVDENGYVRDGW